MIFGSLSAGLAVPAFASCVALLLSKGEDKDVGLQGQIAGGILGTALALQLLLAWWQPAQLVPSKLDQQAGDNLVQILEDAEGDVFVPYHPWYAHLAGKPTYTHLMGLRDMTTGKVWPILGLREAIEEQRFGAIVLDNRPLGRELSSLHRGYRMDDYLPATASPHVFTGAGAVWNKKVQVLIPHSVWVANKPLVLPEGAKLLWNFESGKFGDWRLGGANNPNKQKRKNAWGSAPVSRPLPKQGPVRRYGGRYYLSSFHGGDETTGTLRSPVFKIEGSTITFRLSGGESKDLRVELRIGGVVERSDTGTNSDRMEDISWSVAAYAGQDAEIVLIDDDKGDWGHLNVDEFWIW
jgi:hypothetical protein